MTLIFTKQGKPDVRMIEYDQAVVRLGLVKAELEAEIERKKRETNEVSIALDRMRAIFLKNQEKFAEDEKKEIKEKARVLFQYEKRVEEEKLALDALFATQKDVVNLITERKGQLKEFTDSIAVVEERKLEVEQLLSELLSYISSKEKERDFMRGSLKEVTKEVEEATADLHVLNLKRIESGKVLKKADQDFTELNEVISILQATNRQGLDLVASFDGERKRLRDKEDFLSRKEADLAVYENRLKKYCEKAGYNVEMVFR